MSDAVLVALIVTIGTAVTAAISGYALIQTKQTHMLINSRMDELLAAARAASRAEGVAAGEQSQRDRSSTPEP